MNIVKYWKLIERADGSTDLEVERIKLPKSAAGIAQADAAMLKKGFTRKRPTVLAPHVRYADLPRRT